MLAEIRGRSQITIPAEIIKKMGISEGDKFEVVEKDGGIFLCPVVVYPKEKLLKIAKLIKESEHEISKQQGFDSVEDMFLDMGIDIWDVQIKIHKRIWKKFKIAYKTRTKNGFK